MYDIIFKTEVIDGTGRFRCPAEVAVSKDRISAVQAELAGEAGTVIEAADTGTHRPGLHPARHGGWPGAF